MSKPIPTPKQTSKSTKSTQVSVDEYHWMWIWCSMNHSQKRTALLQKQDKSGTSHAYFWMYIFKCRCGDSVYMPSKILLNLIPFHKFLAWSVIKKTQSKIFKQRCYLKWKLEINLDKIWCYRQIILCYTFWSLLYVATGLDFVLQLKHSASCCQLKSICEQSYI